MDDGRGWLNPSSIFPPISFYILSIAAARRFLPHGINLPLDVGASVSPPSLSTVHVCQQAPPTPTPTSPARRHVRARKAIAKPKDGRTDGRTDGWTNGRVDEEEGRREGSPSCHNPSRPSLLSSE